MGQIIAKIIILLALYPILMFVYWQSLTVLFSRLISPLEREIIPQWLASRAFLIIVISFLILISIFSYITYLSYDKLILGNYHDTGNYINIVTNLINGRGFFCDEPEVQFGYQEKLSNNFVLGRHFYIFLAIQAFFYRLWPHLMNLAWQQLFMVFLGIFAVYGITWEQSRNRIMALILALVYATTFFVHHLALIDFDPEVISLPLLLFMFYFLEKKSYIGFALLAVLLLSLREDMCFVVMGMGVMAYCQRRARFFIIYPLVLGVIYATIILFVLMPYFRGGEVLPCDWGRLNFINKEETVDTLIWGKYPFFLMLIRVLFPLFFITLYFAPTYCIPAIPLLFRNLIIHEEIHIVYPKYWAVVLACLLAGLFPACKRWSNSVFLPLRTRSSSPALRQYFLALFILLANFNTHYLIAPELLGLKAEIFQTPFGGLGDPLVWANSVIISKRFTAPSLGSDVKKISHLIPDNASTVAYNDYKVRVALINKKGLHYTFLPHHPIKIVPGETFWVLPASQRNLSFLLSSQGYRLIFEGKNYLLFFQ